MATMCKANTPKGQFVMAVFEGLHRKGVKYAVLRNYEGLPDDEGNDIDLLIGDGQVDAFESVLFQVARERGWHLIQNLKRHAFASYVFVSSLCDPERQVLVWDIWGPVTWKGIPWIDSTFVLDNAHLWNGFRVLSPGAEAALLLLKDALQTGEIRKKYVHRIVDLCQSDRSGFQSALAGYFGEQVARDLLHLVEKRQWEQVERSCQALRLALVKRALWFQLGGTVLNFAKFLLSHLRNYVTQQSGFFLSFIGPDGSGKTTISQTVAESLSKAFCGSIHYYHGHFRILPELKIYLRWLDRTPGVIRENVILGTGGNKPGKAKALLYLLYYALNAFLGHLIIAQARARGELVIFDRYFYDYVIQPGFFSPDSLLSRIVLTLIPTPDAIIFLQAPPGTIIARKPELSVTEIARQNQVCNELVNRLPNAYVIDNTLAPNEVAHHVCAIVFQQMASRSKRSWNE